MAYSMYCKLFASLYQGTLRGRTNEILVFTNLLAHTGRDGTVDKHFRAIAEETGLSVDEVKQAIINLENPDPESRSPEEDGARLLRMDDHRAWGWRVVNYGKYRAIRSEEDRAEQNRLAQERFREKRNKSKPASAESKQDKPKEKDRERDKEKETTTLPGFDRFWKTYPLRVGRRKAEEAWGKLGCETQTEKIIQSVQRCCKSAPWLKDGGQFIPHPTTWLNRAGWEDELPEQYAAENTEPNLPDRTLELGPCKTEETLNALRREMGAPEFHAQ